MSDQSSGSGWVKWEAGISPRDILYAGAFLVAVSGYIFNASGKADQTAKDLASLQTDMRTTISGVQREVREGISNIRSDIATLPDQRARLISVERRLSEGDARDVAQDARIGNIERQTIETAAQVNNLRAASAITLPGAPGVRTR